MSEGAVLLLILVGSAAITVLGVIESNVRKTRQSLQWELERERKKRELLVFDLEMARAVARGGKVYLVESQDAVAEFTPDVWRTHSFFSSQEKAEAYELQFVDIPGAVARIREVTPKDLPPPPPGNV